MKSMSTNQWRWIFLFSAIICFSTSAFADTEPNNVLAEANALALNTIQNGDLFTNPETDSDDWYIVSLPGDGFVTVSGSYNENLVGYVYIYNGVGSQVATAYVPGVDFSISANCLGSGNIYVRVSRSSGAGDYSLEVNSETPTYSADAEPNNSFEEIFDTYQENEDWTGHLGYNSNGVVDGSDYFYILSPHDGNVTLEVSYDEDLYGYIYLYRKTGTQLGFTYIQGTTGSYTALCQAGDTLIARINRTSGCGSYTASFSTSDLENSNDAEPNSSVDVVSSIEEIQDTYEENEIWTGHLGYYDTDTGADADDYFYIFSPRDGNVVLSATYDASLSGYIYLYEKDGTQIGFTFLNGTSGTYTANCFASDTLVARVSRSGGCGSYTASFATTELTYEGDVEPNGDNNVQNSLEAIQVAIEENEEWEGHLGYNDADTGRDNDDYFHLISPEDGNVTLSVDYETGLSGYIYLYEKDGTQIGFTFLNGTSGTYTANCFAGDTLIARINRTGGCGSYLASFDTPDLVYQNDSESNNDFEMAINTANYEINEGHIGYTDAETGADTEDWYEINVAEAPFDLEAKLTKGEGYSGYIYLHNSAGGVIGFVFHSGVGDAVYTYSIAEPGTYYIRLTRTSGCSSYSLGDFCAVNPEVTAQAESDTEICLGDNVVLTANDGLANYKWFKDGVEVGSNQSYVATEAGEYIVLGYDVNTCGSYSSPITVSYLADSDNDGICDVDDNCPNTPGLIGDTCDDGDDTTENDLLNESCDCVGTPIAVASLLTLDCGEGVIQISWAQAGLNDGGTATSETRTIYSFAPDNGNPSPTYQGNTWAYVIISGSLNINPDITANLTTNDDNVLLVNGWPAYQFAGDSDESSANGTFGPWSYFLDNGDQSQEACVGTIEGTVDWNLNCGERDVEIEIYEPGTANSVGSYSTTLSADGEFEIDVFEFGSFDIYVKVDGYLTKSISGTEINVGLNMVDFGSIQAGDLNGDDGVNIIDFSILNGAFGTSSEDPNFNPTADLNCDGGVNIVDVSILNGGFGLTGDAPIIGVP